ncbi:hypothetical protein JT359_10085 [Candidatus Poribacteria bacterium]|nr:hypothetical protein [Candidatus Poribacteria bacterium]
MNSIHWSFDYNTGTNKPDYQNELFEIIKNYQIHLPLVEMDTHATKYTKHVYKILPNYWRGYSGNSKSTTKLSIGTVSIERMKNKDYWDYEVNYTNDTSGEDIHLKFSCENTKYRPLLNTWQGSVRNSCQDAYSHIEFGGKILDENEVRICINDIDISLIIPDKTVPITCNWTLFDVIPLLSNQIVTNEENVEIVLLEDLEQIRANNKIGYLNSIQSPISLDGFFLHGIGLLPSYWWIDKMKTTVIVSNFFESYILKEIIVETDG